MALFLLYVCIFAGSFFSFSLFKRCYTDPKNRIVVNDFDAFSAGFTYLWFLVGVLGASFIVPNLVHLYSFVALLGLSLIVLYSACYPFSKWPQTGLEFLVCLSGAYLLSGDASFPMVLGGALFWLLAWRVFRSFDQFPFISILMTVIWMISLMIVGQVVALPDLLMVLSGVVGLICFSVFRKRLNASFLNLGDPMASFVGYCCAGMWGYFFLKGYISSAICAYSYYLFEVGFMAVCVFKGKEQVPLFIQSLKNVEYRGKTVKILFWDVLIISLLSVFVTTFKQNATSFLLFSTAIVLCYIYMQLSNISCPIPGYKDILKDLRQGMKVFYAQSKALMAQKALEKEKKKPQKKETPLLKNKGKKKVPLQKQKAKRKRKK